MKAVIHKILHFIAVAVLSVISAIGGQVNLFALPVYAEETVKFDETYVMDDLSGATINGKTFNISDYSFNEKRNTGVVMFTEYCYSFYSNKQDNFGLYLYVWNPKGLSFDTSSSLNKVQMSVGDRKSYTKYSLIFLSKCKEENYEGLFYKFKVDLSNKERTAILNKLNSSERFYHLSGIELLEKGQTNATETTVNLEYTFSGYAAGYGSGNSEESTLKCNAEQGEVLTLDVRSTFYRPSGASGGDNNKQDTLHSVYFAVPNALIDEYGKMTAVHATWLNALTNMIFVTGNKDMYNALSPYVGINIGNRSDNFDYAFVSDFFSDTPTNSSMAGYKGTYAYNWGTWGAATAFNNRLQQLDYLFYADNGNADNFVLSASKISAWFKTYTEKFGGELVNGKYSKALFECVDEDFTEVNIRADKTYSLTSETINKSWWDKLFNKSGTVTDSKTYENIQAIKAVTDSDMTGTATEVSERLYISENDYSDFKDFYDSATANKETVYLFRYYQSTYTATECTEFTVPDDTAANAYSFAKKLDTNAYLAQEWVQLDFDIIDVTFTNGGVDTVIPVVSSPMDIVSDLTPPIDTTKDWDWKKIISIIFGVLLLIVLLVVLMPILPTIISFIINIVLLPFKAIAALFKAIFHKRK